MVVEMPYSSVVSSIFPRTSNYYLFTFMSPQHVAWISMSKSEVDALRHRYELLMRAKLDEFLTRLQVIVLLIYSLCHSLT